MDRCSIDIVEETIFLLVEFFKKDFIYLLMRDTERGRDVGRGKSRVLVGSRM